MKAINLRTEYLTRPIGISNTTPRFYWNCDGGERQGAYQIVAKRDGAGIWNSGVVSSDQMTHVQYGGEQLKSRDRIEWSLKLWDEKGTEGEWATSWFEIGLLGADDWSAKWISGDYTPKKNMRYPVDCFQKEFQVEKEVSKARLYITACGLYEAKLNGEKIGDFCLAPGCTDYRCRLQYQTYDMTGMLGKGRNCLEIQLADGWYRGSIGCFGFTNVFGRQTKLLAQLELTYIDGTREIIGSDESFRWSNDGPMRFADLKDGEIYDASYVPSYSGRARLAKEEILPSASNNVAVKEHETFTAELITTPSGKKVLDFGQNIAGFIAFKIKGKKGQKIKLRCGEILDEKGEFTQANMQAKRPVKEVGKIGQILLITGNEKKLKGELQPTPKQEIEFICSGGEDTYQMSFSVFGFRYAELLSEVSLDPSAFKAIAVYSGMEQTGSFECSNQGINQLFENTLWSMKGNFLDLPTDCPTRERLGWTGDAQIFFNTAAYLMDVSAFFRKWLNDVKDSQFKNGKSSAVIPYAGASMLYDNTGGSVGWGDAVVLIPYRFWKCYGDRDILTQFYGVMRKYAMYMIGNTGHKDKKKGKANPYNKYVYEKGMHLGEWLEPEEFRDTKVGMSVLHTEVCTAFLHYTMTHMAEIAQELGKTEDEALFREYAKGAKKAYDFLFLQKGTVDTDRQSKLVRPLALGLVDGEKQKNLEKRLIQAMENRNYSIGTGFLSTPFVLPVLTQAGRADVAYRMLENGEAPSWLAEVKAGATTIWEDWEGKLSQNHYSPGAVCEWLFNTVGGIRPAGENCFEIKPVPGGSLSYAKVEYKSIYGKVASKWSINGTAMDFIFEIPANTKARIELPDGAVYQVGSGKYQFTI
ncbi:MAG TPA: family 78 glycoside hydrolase catalytic domain [Clostridiales bacterium]|nr:family 78 glycoside hydrolase catalytic domain [Clostridiales bacterium]